MFCKVYEVLFYDCLKKSKIEYCSSYLKDWTDCIVKYHLKSKIKLC